MRIAVQKFVEGSQNLRQTTWFVEGFAFDKPLSSKFVEKEFVEGSLKVIGTSLTWPTGTYHFLRGRCLGSHGRSGPKVGAIDASSKSAKVPIAPGPTSRSLDLGEAPEGRPPAAAYLDRQPGISGRIGEADSA
jgi:hypothetical protein